jgi:thiamine-phosphate pyrophosphorylase
MDRSHLSLPRLMLVTRAVGIEAGEGMDRMSAAVRGGVGILQLRDRAAGAAELLARACALRRAFPEICLLVNDRVDVAAAVVADGVQLGTGALPISAARRLLGAEAWVGRSVHSVAEAEAAAAEGADFLIVGTIYATASHPGEAPAGPALLSAAAAAVTLPILAIGGIEVSNVEECIAHGAHGVAVIRAIEGVGDPERAARELSDALRAGAQQR